MTDIQLIHAGDTRDGGCVDEVEPMTGMEL